MVGCAETILTLVLLSSASGVPRVSRRKQVFLVVRYCFVYALSFMIRLTVFEEAFDVVVVRASGACGGCAFAV